MTTQTTINTGRHPIHAGEKQSLPVMLVVHCSPSATSADGCIVETEIIVGRSSKNDFCVRDTKMSGRHFEIKKVENDFRLRDLESTNGTFVNGVKVDSDVLLSDQAVIRAGDSVFVFQVQGSDLLEPAPVERYGIMGRFHVGRILKTLREASFSARHVLVVGPSGAGKELAARAITGFMGTDGGPKALVSHNAAKFASAQEASTTLFGVAAKVFSDVDARGGLIEKAHNGVLFLDETHNLPAQVQKSLLRVIEDGNTSRIGEISQRDAKVRFIFASNAAPPNYGLSRDLIARLRIVEVTALIERLADIPSIFAFLMTRVLPDYSVSFGKWVDLVGADSFESMCLHGFEEENVRGLVDLVDRISTRMAVGVEIEEAVGTVFQEKFDNNPVFERRSEVDENPSAGQAESHYETNRQAITEAYCECEGNLSATERLLRAQDIRCSRRWLGIFLKKWGVKRFQSS